MKRAISFCLDKHLGFVVVLFTKIAVFFGYSLDKLIPSGGMRTPFALFLWSKGVIGADAFIDNEYLFYIYLNASVRWACSDVHNDIEYGPLSAGFSYDYLFNRHFWVNFDEWSPWIDRYVMVLAPTYQPFVDYIHILHIMEE